MKWLLMIIAILGGVGLVVLVLFAIGWTLPVAHVASRQASYRVPPEAVWKAITEPEGFPAWRSDVTRVERLPDRNGSPAWIEHGRNGPIAYEVERSDAPRTLVVRIADRTLPFGGAWTYQITPSSDGCTLTITENGEIYNPIFRVLARYVFGYESTMAGYLESLRKKVE
jgi:hypothetical protein